MDKKLFCASDMYMAAALLSYGFTLADIDRKNPKRQLFYFKGNIEGVLVKDGDSVKLVKEINPEQLELFYISKQLFLPPNYPDSVKSIKLAIHASD